MKKFLAIAAIVAGFTACNNDKTESQTSVDSNKVVTDTKMTTPAGDSIHTVTATPSDSVNKVAGDTNKTVQKKVMTTTETKNQ